MKDMEMREEEEEMKVSRIREKMKEIEYMAYFYQPFNEIESKNWRSPTLIEDVNIFSRDCYRLNWPRYSSYKFVTLPVIDGVVKPCSYSELEAITNFQDDLIQTTQIGRLFRGTITEGSEVRSVIVKTWDFLLPLDKTYAHRPSQFCDEIELYETINAHPYVAKLSRYCCERRLAVVYDEELTTVLSNVLLNEGFGWDKRIKVATQLADLLACLHRKKIAVGSITASCIMIDKEDNIKVFDFGCIYNRVNEDSVIPMKYVVGRFAPENHQSGWTMKCDVFIFGLLLMELIAKKKFDFDDPDTDNSIPGGPSLVHKCFEEVDDQTASDITELTCLCLSLDPGERPTMKVVFDKLVKLRMGEMVGGKRKRVDKEATED